MSLSSEIFIVKENIQALRPFGSVPQSLDLSDPSSFKLSSLTGREKFSEHVFDIPQKTEQAKWCIQKLVNNELSSSKRNARKIDLKHKLERRQYEDVVYFTAAETDVTLIPPAEARNKNVVD